MDLMSLLQGHLTPEIINQMSQETGAAPEQTATAAEGVLSTLLGGLAKMLKVAAQMVFFLLLTVTMMAVF